MERKYRKPPIVEVVCEFRFVPDQPWDMTVPGLVYEQLRGDFQKRRLVKKVQAEDISEPDGIHKNIRLEQWMRFLREDEKAFVQVGPDLLSVNHLAPYPTWEVYEPIVRQGFAAYQQVASPKGLRRIGLRYVNRIEFPSENVELEDYFLFRPFIGPGLPQDFGAFTTGVHLFCEGGRDLLRLQLASAEPAAPGTLMLLLDLDYFLSKPEAVGLSDAFEWISTAHARVQSAFEACLTDSLRERFEPAGE